MGPGSGPSSFAEERGLLGERLVSGFLSFLIWIKEIVSLPDGIVQV